MLLKYDGVHLCKNAVSQVEVLKCIHRVHILDMLNVNTLLGVLIKMLCFYVVSLYEVQRICMVIVWLSLRCHGNLKVRLEGQGIGTVMSPPTGSGDILFFPVRLSICLSVCPSQIVSAL